MFGDSILDILRKRGDSLTEGILVDEGEQTSYCIVLSPRGIDRSFLYNPGANDNFQAADIQEQELSGARFFHFGYPTAIRRIYTDNGIELIKLLQKAKKRGLTTSLDMAYPDPDTEAGRMDWRAWLSGVLPLVDIFLPSLDEIFFMLDRPRFEALEKKGRLQIDADLFLSPPPFRVSRKRTLLKCFVTRKESHPSKYPPGTLQNSGDLGELVN